MRVKLASLALVLNGTSMLDGFAAVRTSTCTWRSASTRALVDADRHVQADILTMPPVTVEVTEKGFADVNNVPTRALVDADRHVQADIVSMPPVSVASIPNPPNLDVALSTRASESKLESVRALLDAIENALATVGLDKLRTTIVDPIPAGANEIGKVQVSDIPKVSTHKYLPPTPLSAGGTATIWTPAAGKAIRCKRIQVSVDAATRIDLRWGTSAFESYFLPANGSIIVNLIGTNQQGAVDTPLTIYSSAAATVTASADGDEV